MLAADEVTLAMRPGRMPEPLSVPRPWLGSYPPGVPPSYEYPLVPLVRFLDDAAQDFPDATAVEFRGLELSYRKLLDQVDRLASALQALELGRGDRIALMLTNCPQHVIALFAVLRIGAVAVEIDMDTDGEELRRQLAESEARAVIFLDPAYERLERLLERLPAVEHLIGTGLGDYLPRAKRALFPLTGRRDGSYVRISNGGRMLRLLDLIKRSAPVYVHSEIDPTREVAAILYTRGQAGERKGVMLTHLNLVANAFQMRLWIPDIQAGRERILCPVPFSSAWALVACLGVGTLSAATFVLVSQFDRDLVRKTIDGQQPSLCVATPAMFAELVEGSGTARFDLSSLRVSLSCGEPLPREVVDRFEELTGGKLRETYGLTEAGPFTHASPVYGMVKSGSVGLPLTDTVCAVIDRRDPTRRVAPGQPGELAVHGPQVMRGYVGGVSEAPPVLKDGWLLTGDIVVVDEDGYFHFVDQKREVIRAGDAEVCPADVEAVLARHPKVAKAVVVGIPDFTGGEMVKAYLVLHDGEIATAGEIAEFCRQELAPHQLPQRYEFRAFLPQTPPGKPMREALIADELAHPTHP
ncbi:MAG: AMP-binding protein [Egibacteraceae bacterium]